MPVRNARRPRSGTSILEMTAVCVIFLMFLFGVLEYCRVMFVKELVDNAAREGARYAVAHTTSATVEADTKAEVKKRFVGMESSLAKLKIEVYQADAKGAKIGNASDARFGQYIAVEVTGEYSPILPAFLLMNNKIDLGGKSLMCSEAN
jgi:Flp pilus assembly protein TadG